MSVLDILTSYNLQAGKLLPFRLIAGQLPFTHLSQACHPRCGVRWRTGQPPPPKIGFCPHACRRGMDLCAPSAVRLKNVVDVPGVGRMSNHLYLDTCKPSTH